MDARALLAEARGPRKVVARDRDPGKVRERGRRAGFVADAPPNRQSFFLERGRAVRVPAEVPDVSERRQACGKAAFVADFPVQYDRALARLQRFGELAGGRKEHREAAQRPRERELRDRRIVVAREIDEAPMPG